MTLIMTIVSILSFALGWFLRSTTYVQPKIEAHDDEETPLEIWIKKRDEIKDQMRGRPNREIHAEICKLGPPPAPRPTPREWL